VNKHACDKKYTLKEENIGRSNNKFFIRHRIKFVNVNQSLTFFLHMHKLKQKHLSIAN